MTKIFERTLIFLLFLALTIASAAIEIWIIVKTIETGDLTFGKGALAVINGGVLVCFIRLFATLVKKMFIEKDLITENDLKRYFQQRMVRIRSTEAINPANREMLFLALTEEALRLTEELLRSWLGPYRFEISVFANREHPEIVAYYETGGQSVPRSKSLREQDPDYYRNHEYKVVDLLDNPRQDIVVVPDTHDPHADYRFASDQQRARIRSTLLYCFCVETPRALVIVCDRGRAIKGLDERSENLIHAIGMAIQCECEMAKRILWGESDTAA